MGFLDRLLGRTKDERSFHGVPGHTGGQSAPPGDAPEKYGYAPDPGQTPFGAPGEPGYGAAGSGSTHRDPDDVAVERYRYLLRTAPPDAVEQAHTEAFARLTPEQRRRVLDDLAAELPAAEHPGSDDPRSLARTATRAEMRDPGTLERTFRDDRTRTPGLAAMAGSSMLGTVAGVVIGSTVANAMFGPSFGDPAQDFAGETGGAPDTGSGSETQASTQDDAGAGGDFLGDGGFGGGFDAF